MPARISISSTRSDARPPRASPPPSVDPASVPPRVDPAGLCAHHRAQRLPVQRAALCRQRRAVRRSAQQFSERGARSPDRHPDHARAGLSWKWRAAPACTSRASTFRGTFCCAVRRRPACRYSQRPDHRRASRRRAAVRGHLPRAAAPACGDGAAWDPHSLGARDQTADSGAHAAEPEARLRPDVLVSPGAGHHRAAAGGRSVGDQRAARSRPARLSPERLLGGAARSAGLPAVCRREAELDDDERDEQRRSGSTSSRSSAASRR